jgi:hypothetical protein
MKRIIFDYFKRWCLVLTAILIAYFVFQAISAPENNSQTSSDRITASIDHTISTAHNIFIFQAIMWLGFLLVWDIQRGLPRVLISMPLTAKQIGRAWWLASVAFPAIAVGAIGLLAVLIFSGGTNTIILLENYLADWVLIALYLGAIFGSQTFMAPTMADTFTGKIRNILFRLFFAFTLFGFIFLQLEALTMIKLILFFSASAILSVFGWFRAERLVLQRAGFRLVAQSSRKKTARHKIPQGFGGLPYLVQRIFIQSTLIGLGLMAFMVLVMSFFVHGQDRAQSIISIVGTGSTPYVFYILMFSIIPIVFQLRALRSLPIPPSTLAATFVFLPIFSVAAVGVIVIAVAGFVLGQTVMMPTANNFLMLAAKAAIVVPLVVWRGLETPVYILIFLLVLSDSFISLGMTIIFHLGSKSPDRPWWVNLSIFLLCLAVSLVLTRRLLTKSSSAYRVQTMPTNAWSMARR